jgi:hypothetical protein
MLRSGVFGTTLLSFAGKGNVAIILAVIAGFIGGLMKKRPLQVVLQVREQSVIDLTVGERIQLDRLTPSHRGYIPERHGGLLDPGTTTMTLAEGRYCFKTLSGAHLHVVRGGVDVDPMPDNKEEDWPDPTKGVVGSRGDEPTGESPTLTVE